MVQFGNRVVGQSGNLARNSPFPDGRSSDSPMRVYFDHNATPPPSPEATEAVLRALTGEFGNASSVHHFGQRAKALLDEARTAVAALIHGEQSEIVFTSGGTASAHLT